MSFLLLTFHLLYIFVDDGWYKSFLFFFSESLILVLIFFIVFI